MPRAAIATGVADFVLPVRDVAERLAELIKVKHALPPLEPEVDEELLRRIFAHLRVRTGHDFSKYKRSTVLRRVARRMQVTRTDSFNDYYEFMRNNADGHNQARMPGEQCGSRYRGAVHNAMSN